jgi:hypothetical protein
MRRFGSKAVRENWILRWLNGQFPRKNCGFRLKNRLSFILAVLLLSVVTCLLWRYIGNLQPLSEKYCEFVYV